MTHLCAAGVERGRTCHEDATVACGINQDQIEMYGFILKGCILGFSKVFYQGRFAPSASRAESLAACRQHAQQPSCALVRSGRRRASRVHRGPTAAQCDPAAGQASPVSTQAGRQPAARCTRLRIENRRTCEVSARWVSGDWTAPAEQPPCALELCLLGRAPVRRRATVDRLLQSGGSAARALSPSLQTCGYGRERQPIASTV